MICNDEWRREQMRIADIRDELIDKTARDLAAERPGTDPDELAYEAARMVEDARIAAMADMALERRGW